MSQKSRLLQMFHDNNNKLFLGQIMATDLGCEFRTRFFELRKHGYKGKYYIINCQENKAEPSKNLYTLIELDHEIVEKINQYRKLQTAYPKEHNQYDKIQLQIDKLEKNCRT